MYRYKYIGVLEEEEGQGKQVRCVSGYKKIQGTPSINPLQQTENSKS